MKLLIFLFSLLIGSFLNVCIYRIPREESIVLPSSHCPKCNKKIKWYDNIPVVSYLVLLGKCRYCEEEISLQYPIVEILNGIIYLVLFYVYGLSIDFAFYAIISSTLIIIFLIDLNTMIIPDMLILMIFAFSIIYKILNYFIYYISPELLNSLIGLFLSGGLFLFIIIITKGGMGGGDITLISALGFILGVKYILLTIFLSFILGAIISLFLLLFKIKSKKDPIPFGPFIILSFFIVLLYGESILNWYFNLLL